MPNSVKITAPNFDLQKKLKAPIKQLPQERLHAAEQVIDNHKSSFDTFLNDKLKVWKTQPELTADQVYRDAHDLRGLAGTFRRNYLGQAADLICIYVDGARDASLSIDPATLAALKNVVTTCATHEEIAPEAAFQLLQSAREAINKKLGTKSA